MQKLIFATLVGLLACVPALAWHAAGHKVTAEIAFDQLSETRQQEVTTILRSHPRYAVDFGAEMPASVAAGSEYEQGKWLFAQASVWPDMARDFPDAEKAEHDRSRWHYINMTVWLKDSDEKALDGKLDHNMATEFSPPLRQNLNSVQALRGNLAVWRNESASMADKAVALCWILHLTGDIHQPLHNAALFSKAYLPKGDLGGNRIEVVWGEDTRNLHAVWDGLPNDMDDLSPTARTLRSIREDFVDDEAINIWLHDHTRLAERFVYTDDLKSQLLSRLENGKTPLVSVSHEYLVAGRSIARRQINLAGYRIAALLEPAVM